MDWLISAIGGAVVVIILRDVFHTLWHPTRHGGLSRLVMTTLWRLSSRGRRKRRAAGVAGPLGMALVVAMWALGVAVGWAVMYWPHMPEAFVFSSALEPTEHSQPVDALYVSLVIVGTLGLGDIAPAAEWLRVVAPLEALVGLALLTATVSWVLGVFPALARRRTLALRICHLRRAGVADEQLDCDTGATVLDALAADIARVSVDFAQYPESYYFYDGTGDTSLARSIGYAAELAERMGRAKHPGARIASSVLGAALDDLASVLDERFLRTGKTRPEILGVYARDHGGGM
ncbi:two pore domain potassium channel family protein [Streptomyces ferrugineus]|uniref:Two pore domain potassium channel family protein n=1 Tax=Streptomyces ferrugineus TaxID=1413221 RepID=A0A7M2SWJ4_9ACTN|nr:potassium channel family protein [Streptomyces ferrugineus]QOV40737.1 two pore domain potassium channel family protein [Streptomyces ferrugineus]